MEGWTQLVFNDDVQNSFDLNMWVCVSTTFDVRRIKTAMLASATKVRAKLDNFATLQDALKDDWNDDNYSDWDRLLALSDMNTREAKSC